MLYVYMYITIDIRHINTFYIHILYTYPLPEQINNNIPVLFRDFLTYKIINMSM